MSSSLAQLKDLLGRPAHTFRPTMQTFADLDVQRIAAEMKLAERGRERGTKEQPAAGDDALDAVETEIVEHVAAAQKRAQDEVENQLATFRQRLMDLDFEARFAGIRDVAQGGLADLKAEQQMGLDDLHGARVVFTEAEQHLHEFRRRHRITRPGKLKSALGTTLKWLVLVAILVAEMIANGYFLSGGSDLGLVGGIVQAVLFALLNVGVPLLIALKGLPFLFHRNLLAKLWGLFWLLFFLAFTVVLNLGLAHYRELGESASLAEAGVLVMDRIVPNLTPELWPNLFRLADLNSWILMGLGLLFSVIALIDGYSLVDRYPGYQEVSDNRRKAQQSYADLRRTRIQDLTDVRQEYQEAVSGLRADLSKRRTEHEAILAHRQRLLTLFEEHQNQNEKAANALLRVYRDANLAARTTPAPARFLAPYALPRIAVTIARENEWSTDDLKAAIREAQVDLEKVMATLGAQFDAALEDYRKLDQLAPGN